MKWIAIILAAGVLPVTYSQLCLAHGGSDPVCETAGQQPDVMTARADLQHAPDVLSKRLKLADLLMTAGCFDEAVHVLEAGESSNPRNNDLQYRLTRARSMIKEKQYFEGMDAAEAAAQLRRGILRCTQLSDVAACEDVLAIQPTNAEIFVAKGNALSKANRIDEAIAAFARADQLTPGNAAFAARLQAAQAQRQTYQQRCMSSDADAALQACQAILTKGGKDELAVTLRMAVLEQSGNQPAKALELYIAANSLKQGDKAVALAIVALDDSTARKDAVALAARGSALITLGRPSEAVTALRQAQALTPNLPDIDRQLASAIALAREPEVARTVAHDAVAQPVTGRVAAAARTSYSNKETASRSN